MFANGPKTRLQSGVILFQEFEGERLNDPLHRHSEFELSYVLRGTGEWQLGTASGRFAAGTLLLCPPGDLHRWSSDADSSEASGMALRFRREALPKGLLRLEEMSSLRSLMERANRPLEFEAVDRDRLQARLRSVERAQGALRLARFFVALDLIATFKSWQLIGDKKDRGGLSPRELARAAAVKRYLAEHFTEDLGRSRVAARAGMEEAAFSRFFRQAMGTTFVDYLASLRVRRAATLLGSRRDLAVPEVARLSGFRNLSSFHRQFKKRLGTTPDGYRKAANLESMDP